MGNLSQDFFFHRCHTGPRRGSKNLVVVETAGMVELSSSSSSSRLLRIAGWIGKPRRVVAELTYFDTQFDESDSFI